MSFETTLLFITASVNSLLSLFVLLGKRNTTNIIYSIFVLFASFWAIGLGFFLQEADLAFSLTIANFYYISAFGISVFFFYFSLVFLKSEEGNIKRLLIFMPVVLLTVIFYFDKNFIVKDIFLTNWGKDVLLDNLNYILYSAFFVIFVILSYVNLINTYYSTKNNEEKKQLKFIIFGTMIGFIFGMFFNLALPLLGNYRYIFLGPVFSFSMVASIAYSITRHHLFDIKIVVTEILIFILWVFIFVRTILSSTTEDQLANAGLLIASIIIGIFLIRSVIKEVHQREQIQQLADTLKEANQGQASLMHFMNHQIKGRLGNIKDVFAELIAGSFGVMPEESISILKKGLEEADTGVNYVQGILKGASAESGTLPFEMKEMDFKSLVEEVVEKQREHAEKKELTYNFNVESGDYMINGDVVQLGEAVRNLIDNSINYTLTGNINISLRDKSGNIVFSVKDTGVGLSNEDKLKLFQAGGRGVDSLKVNVNATGYGLVFVKGVVESHKGRVWAESEGVQHGSTFILELPKLNK